MFKLTNITNQRTAYVNTDLVQFIEYDEKTNLAILTMANGEVFHTNEDYDELLEDWEIRFTSCV